MKQSNFLRTKEVFHGSDIVRKITSKTIETRDSSAILARANHNLSMDFAFLREQCALFRKKDCFECLPPHKIAV